MSESMVSIIPALTALLAREDRLSTVIEERDAALKLLRELVEAKGARYYDQGCLDEVCTYRSIAGKAEALLGGGKVGTGVVQAGD